MRAEIAPSSSTSGASFLRNSIASTRTGSTSRRVRSASGSVNSLGSGASCSFSSSGMVRAATAEPKRSGRKRPHALLPRCRSVFSPRRNYIASPAPEKFPAHRMSGTRLADAQKDTWRLSSGSFSQAFLAVFTGSHTFDASDHFFSHILWAGAVKLTSRGGVWQMALVGPVSENIDDARSASVSAASAGQVLTFDEIENLTAESGKPAETLMNVVALIARRFQTDVCSAYLLEPDRAHLVLAATLGLRSSCVGRLRMALTEGLAGSVAEQLRPVAVEQVRTHPRFKYFSEAGEEPYQSFLGVPRIERGVLQGVLVVQTIGP